MLFICIRTAPVAKGIMTSDDTISVFALPYHSCKSTDFTQIWSAKSLNVMSWDTSMRWFDVFIISGRFMRYLSHFLAYPQSARSWFVKSMNHWWFQAQINSISTYDEISMVEILNWKIFESFIYATSQFRAYFAYFHDNGNIPRVDNQTNCMRFDPCE